MGFLHSRPSKTNAPITNFVSNDSSKSSGIPKSDSSTMPIQTVDFLNTSKLTSEEARKLVKSTWDSIIRQSNTALQCDRKKISPTIRIFVSSTFSDFHSEREFLTKEVFPEIRELCESRGIPMVEIDLRWGVPTETTSSDTIAICMDELDRCSKDELFFIGFLGNRYGWIPSEKDVTGDYMKRYSWIPNLSITHMEILRGAFWLNNPNAIFFIRNPSSLATIPPEYKDKFMDRDDYSKFQMEQLKERLLVRFSNRCYRYSASFCGFQEGASSTKVKLGNFDDNFKKEVLQFLKDRISDSIETAKKTDSLSQGGASHTYLTDQLRRNFVGRSEELQKLLHWLQPPISSVTTSYEGSESVSNKWQRFFKQNELSPIGVVEGIKGSGKSALLAQFIHSLEESKDKEPWIIFIHHCGLSPDGSRDSVLLRRLIALSEAQKFSDDMSLSKLVDDWRTESFPRIAESGRKFLLVIDGLDQLDGNTSVQHLEWLPPACSSKVKILVSFRQEHSPTGARIKDRLCTSVQLKPLTRDEQELFVSTYLKDLGKKFDELQMGYLLEENRSPDWLSLALEELRVFGLFSDLNSKIRSFPSSLDHLSWQIIQRILNESFVDKCLVENMLSLMACSPRGLTGSGLRVLLEKSEMGEELPSFIWVQTKRLLKSFFRFGPDDYVTWSSDSFKQVIRKELLVTEEQSIGYHKLLAQYYERYCRNTKEICQMYPHHLLRAQQPEVLVHFVFKDKRALVMPIYSKREYLLEVKCNAMVVDIHPDVTGSTCHICSFCSQRRLPNCCTFCGISPATRPARLCMKHGFGHPKCLLCGEILDMNRVGQTVFNVSLCDWCKGHGVDHCSFLPIPMK